MIPILLITSEPQSYLHQHIPHARKDHPDVFQLKPEKSIRIKDTRELKKFCLTRPFQQHIKHALIHDAHTMTIPAQNSLLKILEESPEYTQIILMSHKPDQLLSTIHSRCRLITFTPSIQHPPSDSHLLIQLAGTSIPDRINIASQHAKTRQTAIDYLTELSRELHQQLLTNPHTLTAANLKLVHQSIKDLHSNTNVALTLEYTALQGHWIKTSISPHPN